MLVSTTGLSRVIPKRSGQSCLSICIMNVEISLPGDIANSCNTITDDSDHTPWIEFTENNSPRPKRYGDCACEAARVACAMLNAKNAVTYSKTRAPVRCILRRTSDMRKRTEVGLQAGYYGGVWTKAPRRSAEVLHNRGILGSLPCDWELAGN